MTCAHISKFHSFRLVLVLELSSLDDLDPFLPPRLHAQTSTSVLCLWYLGVDFTHSMHTPIRSLINENFIYREKRCKYKYGDLRDTLGNKSSTSFQID